MFRDVFKLVFISQCVFGAAWVNAAEWSVEGHVNQSLAFDDNVNMRADNLKDPKNPNPQKSSVWYRILPTLTFAHKTDVSEVRANATYGTQTYSDFAYDQDIQNYNVSGNYNTDRFVWGGNFNYGITPTRNSGFQTGNFSTNATTTSWSIAPSMRYKLSEIDSLVFIPTYSETSFAKLVDGTVNGGVNEFGIFRDSWNVNLNLGWQRLWSEKYSTNLSVFGSVMESQSSQSGNNSQQQFNNDSVGFNFGNAYSLSENWKLDGTVGLRYTQTQINGFDQKTSLSTTSDSSSFGFLTNASIHYIDDNYESALYVSRSLNPSSFGNLQEQTLVGWDLHYQILEHLSVGLRTDYQHSSIVNQSSKNQNINSSTRDNIVVQPNVRWGFAKDWSLSGSYRYRTQDREQPDGSDLTAESNLFMLSVNYQWPGLKLSK